MASRKGSSQKLSKPNRNPPNVTWQHSWSSSETATGLAESRLGRLPPEVLLQIFKGLSVHDLGNISLTCRALKIIADQDDIWKLKCKSSTKIQSKSFKEVYMDWMHEKYLRNIELEAVEAEYRVNSSHVACGMRCGPPQYPIRPDGKHDFGAVGGFKEHPNQSSTMSIDLSVDIDKMAKELLSLLEKAEQFKEKWRESSVIKRMITRYYRFLQLKASAPSSVLLIPTLDIEIIWQTHLLRPTMYHDDCLRLFHRIIDHSLLTSDIEQFLKEKAFIETCKLYEERFGEEYCPLPEDKQGKTPAPRYGHQVFSKLECFIPNYLYWDETYFKFESLSTPNHDDNPFSFTEADVILDSNWLSLCKKFMNDMEKKLKIDRYPTYGKHFQLRHAILERLKKSYERFLYLATKYPPSNGYQFVHPTYAIDIIWHSHMQEPLKYVADCQRLVGYLVDHAPWPSVDSNKMKNSCDDTANVWKKEFDSDMQIDHLVNTKNGELDWHYD